MENPIEPPSYPHHILTKSPRKNHHQIQRIPPSNLHGFRRPTVPGSGVHTLRREETGFVAAAWQRVEAQDPSPGAAGIPTAAIPWNFPWWFPVSVR